MTSHVGDVVNPPALKGLFSGGKREVQLDLELSIFFGQNFALDNIGPCLDCT